jgi:hypothetical protein
MSTGVMSTGEYIQMLEMRVLEIKTENGTLKTENERLRRENEALKNRLRFYENPNTPPSQPTLKKQKERDERIEKKRGVPPGHRGATKKHRDPDKVIDLTTFCPCCNHELGEPIKTETKRVEDIPPPKKIKVTQFNTYFYKCPNCGAEIRSKHRGCPQVRDLGIYLLVYLTMLKYHLRGKKGERFPVL